MSSPPPGNREGESYDSWPTQSPQDRPPGRSCCCKFRISWTAVSVVELLLTTATVVVYLFFSKVFLKQMMPKDTKDHGQVNELSEWLLRLFASMIVVQVCDCKSGMLSN